MLVTAFIMQHDHFMLKKFMKISLNIMSTLQCDLECGGVGLPAPACRVFTVVISGRL